MMTIVKSLLVCAYLLLVMLPPLTDVRAADAPLRKSSPSQEREVTRSLPPSRLSRREIFQAIQNDLAQRGISSRAKLRPGDLNIQSALPALGAEVGLKVKKVAFDPIRRETVFELWASQEPQYLPFEVTTRLDPWIWGLTSHLTWKSGEAGGEPGTGSPTTGHRTTWLSSKVPVMVKPGRPATLVMLGQNVRITTTVDPLQPGIKGQSILVRESTTARVMTAEVVDDNLLRTTF